MKNYKLLWKTLGYFRRASMDYLISKGISNPGQNMGYLRKKGKMTKKIYKYGRYYYKRKFR